MKLITNVRIVTPEEILDGCQVVIHEDQILRIQPHFYNLRSNPFS